MDSNIQLKNQFTWTSFYMEFADKLLPYKDKRSQLLVLLKGVYEDLGLRYPFIEKYGMPMEDICPFTVFGCFNKGISTENRIALMKGIGSKLGVKASVPTEFDGIPVLNNMSAWFFTEKSKRKEDDISNLWDVFEAGINYADNPSEISKTAFIGCYDKVRKQLGIKWNLTMGLYWIRPFFYLNLDERNRSYLIQEGSPYYASITKISDLKQLPSAKTYLELISACKEIFAKSESPHHSFPELSYAAWIITTSRVQNKNGISNAKNKVGWIFQSNPKYYDVIGAIKDLDVITLSVKQYQDEIKKGDRAYIWISGPESGIVASGIIKCDPEIRENNDPDRYDVSDKINTEEIPVVDIELTHKITDAVIKKEVLLADERLKNVSIINFPNDTNFKLTTEQADTIDSIISGSYQGVRQKYTEELYEPYTEEDFLSEVFMDAERYGTLVNLLKTKKNIILQGAPGVGKTFVAKRLAFSIMGQKDTSRVMMVQFHQSYSYEDFIMGFRPSKDGFELSPGPFYQFCKKAHDDDERDYFFIIDEINRGNVSKIFGELMMLIEKEKRGEKLRLLYSNELFSVPKNVYIIGMMNTADRSLAIIDYALRRRFAFFELEPAFDSEGFKAIIQQANNPKFNALVEQIKSLNDFISKDESLGSGFRIGHSYLCPNSEVTDNWLKAVVEFELLPLLREYWFDEPSKITLWEKKLKEALNLYD